MGNRANGRAAIVIVAGLLAFYAGPVKACEGSDCERTVLAQNEDPEAQASAPTATRPAATKTTKRSARHARASRHKASRLASKSSTSRKKTFAADKPANRNDDRSDGKKIIVSPSVANANAQMIGSPATTADAAKSPPDGAQATMQQAATQDVAQATMQADAQASAISQESAPENAPVADADAQVVASDQLNDLDRAAVEEKPARILRLVSQTPLVANAGTEDAWNQTSLIGKIFIAFGGFLMLASAARMFIA